MMKTRITYKTSINIDRATYYHQVEILGTGLSSVQFSFKRQAKTRDAVKNLHFFIQLCRASCYLHTKPGIPLQILAYFISVCFIVLNLLKLYGICSVVGWQQVFCDKYSAWKIKEYIALIWGVLNHKNHMDNISWQQGTFLLVDVVFVLEDIDQLFGLRAKRRSRKSF